MISQTGDSVQNLTPEQMAGSFGHLRSAVNTPRASRLIASNSASRLRPLSPRSGNNINTAPTTRSNSTSNSNVLQSSWSNLNGSSFNASGSSSTDVNHPQSTISGMSTFNIAPSSNNSSSNNVMRDATLTPVPASTGIHMHERGEREMVLLTRLTLASE